MPTIALPELILDGEFLLSLVLIALALMLFATYAIANHIWVGMRPGVAGITIVGGALAGAGDHVVGALRSLALGLNQSALWAIQTTLNTLHTLSQWVTATLVNPLISAYNGTVAMLGYTKTLAENLFNTVHNDIMPSIAAVGDRVTAVQHEAENLYNQANANAQADATVVSHYAEQLYNKAHGEITADHAAWLVRVVAIELGIAPLLAVAQATVALADPRTGVFPRLRVLDDATEALRGRVNVLERDLAKLAPLAGLAALPAVAISVLEQVARDPCAITQLCQLLNDLPDRVEALENFGP